jgi:hypothetical protein
MISATNRLFGISFSRQRTRRRVLCVYWAWVVAFSVLFLRHQSREGLDGMNALIVTLSIVNLSALLGGVRSGGAVKPFRGIRWVPLYDRDDIQRLFRQPPLASGNLDPADGELDERERRLRDGVHTVAYTLCRWLALVLFAVYALLSATHSAWTARTGPFFFFLLTLILWSLPHTLILWNEPDLENAP